VQSGHHMGAALAAPRTHVGAKGTRTLVQVRVVLKVWAHLLVGVSLLRLAARVELDLPVGAVDASA